MMLCAPRFMSPAQSPILKSKKCLRSLKTAHMTAAMKTMTTEWAMTAAAGKAKRMGQMKGSSSSSSRKMRKMVEKRMMATPMRRAREKKRRRKRMNSSSSSSRRRDQAFLGWQAAVKMKVRGCTAYTSGCNIPRLVVA